jgi:hypothetical protein
VEVQGPAPADPLAAQRKGSDRRLHVDGRGREGPVVEGRLLVKDDPLAARAYAHLKAGSVTGLSIGYRIPKGGAEWDPKSETYRLKQLDLYEVSLVTFPANDEAQVESVKAALAAGPKEFERFLRDAGLSRSQAKALMSGGYKALDLRDADAEDEQSKNGSDVLFESTQKLLQALKGQ